MKSLAVNLIVLFFSMNAFAAENHCRIDFSTFVSNGMPFSSKWFPQQVKKKLWTENWLGSAEECNEYVQNLLKRYQNVRTRWSHLDVTYENAQGVVSHASFIKH